MKSVIGYNLGPRIPAPGKKDAGYVPPGALGGTYRDIWGMIWADSMGLSDSEFLLDYINFVFSVL